MFSCACCGKTLRRRPGEKRRYCSRQCYVRSGAETAIERVIREILDEARVPYQSQVQIGRYTADFIVADQLVIEADGTYWHAKRPGQDARKTSYLYSRGYQVWRFDEAQILDPNFRESLLCRLGELDFTDVVRVDVNASATAAAVAA
jgi:very-short-patch-repair endonuclease